MTNSESISRRLLVIDDDLACRTTIAYLLQRLGHTVDAAENGSAGIALLRQKPVDLVLTDLMMPGLTGWDVARLVKVMRPRLPVVLVTGCAHAIPPDQPERAFVDAILAKPFGVGAMQAVIGPLTRGRTDAMVSAGPESEWLTKARGRPTNSPVQESGLNAPVDVHRIPVEGDASASTGLAA
jgi:two-component system OmpR family response regulator